jgi:hypothetical protein
MSKQKIPYRSAPQAMQQAWDRMERLCWNNTKPATFDLKYQALVVAAHKEALAHYRKAARKAGCIAKGRNMPAPDLVKVKPLEIWSFCAPKGEQEWKLLLTHLKGRKVHGLDEIPTWDDAEGACIQYAGRGGFHAFKGLPSHTPTPLSEFIERLTPDFRPDPLWG